MCIVHINLKNFNFKFIFDTIFKKHKWYHWHMINKMDWVIVYFDPWHLEKMWHCIFAGLFDFIHVDYIHDFKHAISASRNARNSRYEIHPIVINTKPILHNTGKCTNAHWCYLKFNMKRLEHVKSTSFKLVERLRLILDRCRKFAIEGITTFLILGHPVQLRTSSRRPDRSLISSLLIGEELGEQKSTAISTELLSSDPHTNSWKFVHPFKFTLTKLVQQARRSSIAFCPMDE